MAHELLHVLMVIGGTLLGVQPAPGRAEAPLRIYEMTWPDQQTRDFYNVHGFMPYPQMTAFRLATLGKVPLDRRFDSAKLELNGYTPEMSAEQCECTDLAGHMSGPPPGWGVRGEMIQIDLEKPFTDSYRAPDSQFNDRQAAVDVAVVIDSAKAIRERWPGCLLLSYHQQSCGDAAANSKCRGAEEAIALFFDGNCVPLYIRDDWDVDRIRSVNRLALWKALRYKATHPGWQVYAEVWALARNEPRAPLNETTARAQLADALAYAFDGPGGEPVYIDGLVIFGKEFNRAANLPYARWIVEEAAKAGRPIVSTPMGG